MTVARLMVELARRGVTLSDETIRNYVRRDGMPCRVDQDGTRRYEPDTVYAWIKAHKPAAMRAPGEGGLGGRRRGAGRKSKDEHLSRQTGTLHSVHQAAAVAASVAAPVPASVAASDPTWLEDALRPIKIDERGQPTDESGMTKLEAERRQAIIASAQKQADLDERLGALLPRDGVLEAWAEQLNALRIHLETGAARWQATLTSSLGLSPVMAARVRAEADGFFRDLLSRMASDPLALQKHH